MGPLRGQGRDHQEASKHRGPRSRPPADGRERRVLHDILTQITAASNTLKKVAVGLLDDHIRHCVAQGSEEGKDMVREATAANDA